MRVPPKYIEYGAILGLCWGCMGKMEKKKENTITGYIGYRIWGSYYNIPKARFYLLKGD